MMEVYRKISAHELDDDLEEEKVLRENPNLLNLPVDTLTDLSKNQSNNAKRNTL